MREPLRFISGMANCHLPGLYSLVLSERESPEKGMRRVFYCSHTCKMDLWDGADFRLKPHNHRQDITITRLCGNPRNVSLKTGFGQHRVWCYHFGSALLNGDFALERMNHEDAQVKTEAITDKPLYLHWSTVHTIVAEPGDAWLVEEGVSAPEGTARCWSVDHDLKLSSAGLYHPLPLSRDYRMGINLDGSLEWIESVVNTLIEKEKHGSSVENAQR